MPKKTSEEETTAQPKPPMRQLIRVCVAAWLIPGFGHLLQRRKWRALVLFASILGMFLLGLVMEGTFYSFASPSYLQRLGYLGELCVGIPMAAAKFFGYAGGDPFFVSSDFGTAFLVAAGMLNVLSVLDAFDIAMGRKP